uniref:Uncharacterized protein n=1 Tax=Eutreptiella gymnastica TaxID=73025 RepID=A0A7S1IMI0_9EUGL|mmetsp:Transcript_27802/g.50170  ORF Transcript_27802/g.50170 Transcript_27802/m.50170 type:complete len:152 (+) Transcript_27802:24-479(+)
MMSSLGPLPDINAAPDSSIKDEAKWKTDFAMCLSVPNHLNIIKPKGGNGIAVPVPNLDVSAGPGPAPAPELCPIGDKVADVEDVSDLIAQLAAMNPPPGATHDYWGVRLQPFSPQVGDSIHASAPATSNSTPTNDQASKIRSRKALPVSQS